jgi:hypothetical protein
LENPKSSRGGKRFDRWQPYSKLVGRREKRGTEEHHINTKSIIYFY